MALIICPECGKKYSSLAQACPNCGYPTSRSKEDSKGDSLANKQRIITITSHAQRHNTSLFIVIVSGLILILALFIWAIIKIPTQETATITNYNNGSISNKNLAKIWFVQSCIEPQLKDPKSYEEINSEVEFDSLKDIYKVSIKYRAKNSYGGYSIEEVSGLVVFTKDDHVKCKILKHSIY